MKPTLLAVLATAFALAAVPASAIDSSKILVPTNPGGGWGETARNLARAIRQAGVVGTVHVDNRGGRALTTGLARFVTFANGDVLIASKLARVGEIERNKLPVSRFLVAPIARLTAAHEMIVRVRVVEHHVVPERVPV